MGLSRKRQILPVVSNHVLAGGLITARRQQRAAPCSGTELYTAIWFYLHRKKPHHQFCRHDGLADGLCAMALA